MMLSSKLGRAVVYCVQLRGRLEMNVLESSAIRKQKKKKKKEWISATTDKVHSSLLKDNLCRHRITASLSQFQKEGK